MSISKSVSDLITLALAEDLGPMEGIWNAKGGIARGDITSQAFIPADDRSYARIIARTPCVVAGIETASEVFLRIDSSLAIITKCQEGDLLSKDSVLLEVSGSTRSILSAERPALNFLGKLCGIATLSRHYADAVAGTGVQLLDTRKTTPGWRVLEKQAVKAGGCVNHRMGLYDAVLVKDNHLAALGDLDLLPSVIKTLRVEHPGLSIEIEADTLDQVKQLLTISGIDVILLDNMSCDEMRQAVALRDIKAPQVLLEASGGITLETIPAIAATGIERISVGALTHSAQNADLSLELEHVV